jgi:hypothetical protein
MAIQDKGEAITVTYDPQRSPFVIQNPVAHASFKHS